MTGGSAGIGLGIAKALADEGAQVFIAGRRQAELDKAVAEIGHGATGIQANAANLADIDRLYAIVKAKHGRIDVLMLNASFYVDPNCSRRSEASELVPVLEHLRRVEEESGAARW